jgi:hypothetical protein
MTLGKIERFWKSIYEEFLVRSQFGSFEEAQERVRHWVKYYNHKRPHQGIGGLFPADRYFEIQGELRKVMEKGIAENVLEMALRGKPREPFYMVGRMEGQSVVLRAEKGKLRLLVDGEEGGKSKELVYEVDPKEEKDKKEEEDGKGGEGGEGGEAGKAGGREEKVPGVGASGGGEVPGGIDVMDGAEEAGGDLPGDGGGMERFAAVAGPGNGGDAVGITAPGCGGEGGGLEPPACRIIGEEEPGGIALGDRQEIEAAAAEHSSGNAAAGREEVIVKEGPDGQGEAFGPGAGGGDPSGAQRETDGDGGSGAVRDLA